MPQEEGERSQPLLDVVGIGNAMVDLLAHAEEALLEAEGLPKGSMTLVDGARAERLYAAMGPAVEASGGSAANTLAGLAALGGAGAFIGKVRNDQLGVIFQHDIRAVGTRFDTPLAQEGPPTGRCMVFVTPDAQRTMATYLGAAAEFGPEDLDLPLIEAAKVLYLEGYLWDSERAKEAFLLAAEAAHAAGRKVALTLSDPFCVERHRDSFLDLVEGHVDLLFANELEIKALYRVERFEAALAAVKGHCEVAALTRSEKGSLVVSKESVETVAAARLGPLMDSTGAGDLYAAGFLYGYTRDLPLALSGRMGALAAGEVITHMGPRPERSLRELLAEELESFQ